MWEQLERNLRGSESDVQLKNGSHVERIYLLNAVLGLETLHDQFPDAFESLVAKCRNSQTEVPVEHQKLLFGKGFADDPDTPQFVIVKKMQDVVLSAVVGNKNDGFRIEDPTMSVF